MPCYIACIRHGFVDVLQYRELMDQLQLVKLRVKVNPSLGAWQRLDMDFYLGFKHFYLCNFLVVRFYVYALISWTLIEKI